ncbi:hypothetical protein BASA81_005121 [Batrachochytrium salamandrivorans]|nr:hypothetical protein BASA81_005121 [Batrachochytrium salamandrivorans]
MLGFALLLIVVASTVTSDKVKVQCDSQHCVVELPLTNGTDGYHRFDLIPEETRLFTKATSFQFEGKEGVFGTPTRSLKRYHTRYDVEEWGTALIENDSVLVDAVFQTQSGGAIEFRNGVKVPIKSRRLNQKEEQEEDMVLDLPEGKFWLPATSGRNETDGEEEVDIDGAEYGVITPFFPGCFPADQITHSFRMNLVYDYGLVQELTQGLTTSAAIVEAIMQEAEHTFSVGKLLYRAQFNINLELVTVIIGSAKDQLPVSRSKSLGTCANALGAFAEMSSWNANNRPGNAGHTMLLSNCFSVIIGTSYIGSLCGSSSYGVSANSYLTLFHELGHAFGMGHTFKGGLGGMMDYGAGMYNGVVQFDYENRAQICPFLTYMKNANSCPFFTPVAANSECGDGIMTKEEECECLDRSTKCGQCSQCKLTSTSVECSSALFVLRSSAMADMVAVDSSLLASPSCCTSNNKLASPKTLCGDGKLNVCSTLGACVPICSALLSYNNPNCGFDASGCLLGCVFGDKCRFDLSVVINEETQFLNALPNGSKCVLSAKDGGLCYKSQCYSPVDYASRLAEEAANAEGTSAPSPFLSSSLSPTTASPSLPITMAPSSQPATSRPSKKPTKTPTTKPTKKPTAKPTKKPTKRPTTRPTKKPTKSPTKKPTAAAKLANTNAACGLLKTEPLCAKKSGCSWCSASCKAKC